MMDAVRRKDEALEEKSFLSAPAEILKRFIIKVFWVDPADDFR